MWKEKISALDELNKKYIHILENNIEALVFLLKARTKEWKENNVRFIKESLDLIIKLVNNRGFYLKSSLIIIYLGLNKRSFSNLAILFIEKISENKYTESFNQLFSLSIEKINFKYVVSTLTNLIKNLSNPKIITELTNLIVKSSENEKNV